MQTKVCWHVACLQCCFVSMSEHVQLHAGELRRWRTGTCSSGAWHCQAGNLTAALPASKQRSATSRTAQCHWRVQLLPECHCPVPLALHLLPHSSHGMAHRRFSGETLSIQPARMSSSLLPSRMCSLAERAVLAQHLIA